MNLSEARKAATFAKVTATGTKKLNQVAYKVTVPGHDGKRYMVLARYEYRGSHQALTLECCLDAEDLGVVANQCPSRAHNHDTTCYHALAATMAIARFNGNKVAFVESEVDAQRLRNLGGKVFRYGRRDRGVVNFAVAFGTKKDKAIEVAA
jgi:hypothetical protein